VGRDDLFERFPGSKFADHAPGNRELQAELREIFATRTSADWIAFGETHNTPIAPVNTPKTLPDDPQFQARLGWLPRERLGAEQLALPLKLIGEQLPVPAKAPTVGEHTDGVLRDILGYDEGAIAARREEGAFG
jgi:crotonobetainyl-CoA:carnitine CoA-transferase CaiB-like acyl-CoA transferase